MTIPTPSQTEKCAQFPAPPLGRLGLMLVGACLVGLVFGWLMHGQDEGGPQAIALAVGSVAVAGAASLLALRALCRMTEPNLGTVCLGVSFVRLFGSLTVGLIVFSVLDPARKPFVNTFLVAAMAALIVETIILRRWAALSLPAPVGGHPTPGAQAR